MRFITGASRLIRNRFRTALATLHELRTRKDLARALLRAGQPAEARGQLQLILAKAPDAEASWLLSRAYLQEGAVPEALVALKEAGSFADEDPTRPDPAPYSGSASCLPCHAEKYQSQQRSRHARTFHRVSELQDLDLPRARVADPIDPSVTHTFQKTDDRLVQETRTPEHLFRAIVDYAFGSGDRGKTLVGHDPSGQALELRLSIYREKTAQAAWDVTSGHDPHPPTDQGFLGLPLTEVAVDRCLSCHVTNPQAVLAASGPEAADHAIGCEKCHGPGGNHLLAVAARFPDLAIARPSLASGARMVKICAQCHSPQGKAVEPDDPTSVRFQGTTLTWSRCYTESKEQARLRDVPRPSSQRRDGVGALRGKVPGMPPRGKVVGRSQAQEPIAAFRPGRGTACTDLPGQPGGGLHLLSHAQGQQCRLALLLHRPFHPGPPRKFHGE